MTARRARVCVLASGGGSNLGALLEHKAWLGETRSFDVTLVVSNRAGTGALARAEERGVETATIDATAPNDALLHLLQDRKIDLVVLAGYLKLVPAGVTAAYRGRLVNIHPALLPAFGGSGMFGHRVHRAVLEAGVRVTGATVHFVDEHYDRGPIIAQWPVPVLDGDTEESLAARVLRAEHALLPRVVEQLAKGRIRLAEDGRVQAAGPSSASPDAGFIFAFSSDAIGAGIDRMLDALATREA